MTDLRRRLGVLAAGAATVALVATPLAALAQDEAMASVSEACQAANLGDMLKTPGRLTLSTDNPAFGPWWGGDPSVDPESGWEFSYPPSGEGLEGGVAYAIAHALGFSDDQVDWLQNTEFSAGLRARPQALRLPHGADLRSARSAQRTSTSPTPTSTPTSRSWRTRVLTSPSATSIADLKGYNLGAAVGTTSLQFIEEQIQPDNEPQVFNNNADLVQALENQQIDGLVVDLGSAFFVIAVQLSDGTIVGQFPTSAQQDQIGAVLELDSPLTDCINEAIAAISASGELQAIYDATITQAQSVPVLE